MEEHSKSIRQNLCHWTKVENHPKYGKHRFYGLILKLLNEELKQMPHNFSLKFKFGSYITLKIVNQLVQKLETLLPSSFYIYGSLSYLTLLSSYHGETLSGEV
ncbi:hypothetical protein LCGC14_1667710, partial [marine sediment metagenome]